MTVALRPMTLGEILDRTFRIYREYFGLFLGISLAPLLARAAVQVSGYLLGGLLSQTTLSSETKLALNGFFSSRLPFNVLWGFFECLSWFVIAAAASAVFLEETASMRSAFASCGARWKSWAGIAAQLTIAWFLVPMFLQRWVLMQQLQSAGVEGVLGTGSAVNRVLTVLFFASVKWLPQWVLTVLLCMSIPLWAVARAPVLRALKAGSAMSADTWRKASFTWLLVQLVQWILFASITYAIGLFLYATGSYSRVEEGLYGSGWVWFSMLPIQLASLLVRPVFPIALTLIYYDRRIRKEGFDIEWMMRSAGMEPALAQATAGDTEEHASSAPEEQQA